MDDGEPAGVPSGYVCPTCGGVLWLRADGDGSQEYRCRIGHAFASVQLWIRCCTARDRAVAAAARAVAEEVELGRALAEEARTLGDEALAARFEAQARSEERYAGQLSEMLGGLEDADRI